MNILRESFFIFDSISFAKQRSLKRRGIVNWDDLYINGKNHFSDKRWEGIEREVKICIENYKNKNLNFFKTFLDEKYHFLLLDDFSDYAIFLDIETTGIRENNEITMIGISDNHKRYRVFLKDINLNENNIGEILKRYPIVVTFFGKNFDIPFIRKNFPGLADIIDSLINIDLYYLGKMVGFKGGLKRIEKQVGILREREIDGMDGYDAVLLWKDYLNGNKDSMIKLIRYNRADVINLVDISEYMLEIFYEMYIKNLRYPYP
ncbi:MAG: ribonuclease H-like domain-containing protein [Thermoplasmata archaeon]